LAKFPRRRYTDGQTPIERLERLSTVLRGPTIYMKRDDLLGLAGGGSIPVGATGYVACAEEILGQLFDTGF
jgi:1-aminocyclopropane-1-carboxylate deaminase/D-cysteine desulfhydrase-like pyridoxal-dependent ACC family enzyme